MMDVPAMSIHKGLILFLWGVSCLVARPALAESAAPLDPGKPVSLSLESEHGTTLVGPDARLQVVATARHETQQLRDWTGRLAYTCSPAGIVQVSESGLVEPLSNGQVTITASAEGLSAEIRVTVERYDDPPAVNFANEVVPIFTKLGCNGGGCHGKSGGQNGFPLSLLGYEPWNDYEYLVKESRGRRIFPAAPDSSLLLLKATNTLPHGGGERLKADTPEYRILRRWISQGMPYGAPTDPKVVSISAYPRSRTMTRDGQQQLRIVAHYSDGSTRDVTRTAQYEPNEKELALVDETGHVKMLGSPGDVAVMVRYQEFVSTFTATVPLGAPIGDLPEPRNFIDELVFAKLRQLGMPPSEPCDDATFIRRVTLDVAGRLPDPQRVQAFLADSAPDKRQRYIDELLDSTDYADYFANKWVAILRNKRVIPQDKEGAFAFHEWVRTSIDQNKPYDQFVRELLTASGRVGEHAPVAWYRQVNQPHEQVEDVAQLFLGVRIQCARCHHHPFEKWSQDDYYGLAAFFSRVEKKGARNPLQADEYRVYHKRGTAQATNPTTGKALPPTALGAEPLTLSPDQDPRTALAGWMTGPDNPFFARSLVNRYWKHFFGRGLVEPEDDIRDTNPPANPALLEALAGQFVSGGYDMKALVREICRSHIYQLSAVPNEHNVADRQAFSRYYPRRLPAEVLLDALDAVNATATDFVELPRGTRAVQLPDAGEAVPQVYFLQVFGRPSASSACECERTNTASLAQSLHLLNSAEVQQKISTGRAPALAADVQRTDEQKVRELYLHAFSRLPTDEELKIALAHIAKAAPDQKQLAYEDIVWALVNTKEFLFNH
jgi:hypothetical protein